MDTKNILFICGGAFDGIDKIIENRMDKKSIGFGAEIKSAKDRNVGQILQNVQSPRPAEVRHHSRAHRPPAGDHSAEFPEQGGHGAHPHRT